MQVAEIDLHKIRTEKRLWQVDEDRIKPLAESIKTVGLINPISVLEDDDGYVLIAGEHRVLAYIYNQESTIPTVVYKRMYEDIEMDKARCLIMEADENLLRRTPDGHEEGYLLWKRKEAYETLFPTPKTEKIRKLKINIKYRVNNNLPYDQLEEELNKLENLKDNYVTFAEDTAEKIGISPATINQKVRIGRIIDRETGEILDDLKIDSVNLNKITVGKKEDDAKAASKIHVNTMEKINDKFESPGQRNTFYQESYDKLKKEMDKEEPKYHINHPVEFSELLKSKIENEYLPGYEDIKNSPVQTEPSVKNEESEYTSQEKLYLKKSENLLFCTSSYLEKHGDTLSFTKGFINLYIDNEKQFAKVTNILNLCDEEDKVLVECSTDNIFGKYLSNIYE